MKKVSKMFALGLALAMTFGITVNAAPSISTGTDVSDKVEVSGAGVSSAEIPSDAKNIEVPAVDVSTMTDEQVANLSQNSSAKYEAVKEVGTTSDIKVPEGATVSVSATPASVGVMAVVDQVADKAVQAMKLDVAANAKPDVKAVLNIDLNVTGGTKADVFAANTNGIKVTFNAGIVPAANKKYLVLHQLASGAWETVPATIAQDGTVIATFSTLSPVAIVEVPLAEKAGIDTPATPDNKDDSNNDNNASAGNNGAATSPKTGETLPVAGLMAVICLAGAVVCAKRVRYNK